MNDLYPLKLKPKPSPRLWGGTRLKGFVPSFKDFETKEPIGEAWLVYGENPIENGALAGQTLQAVANRLGARLLGSSSVARYGSKVPLLAKFLDAGADLSIQVHPGDGYALQEEAATGDLGKTEAWYVLEAAPDAHIVWGFARDVSADEVRQAVKAGELEALLNVVPVTAGDVIYNPAGTVHALGAGLFIFEIQQSSDLTYRLYDFKRRGSDGELRELHVDKALDVATLTAGGEAKAIPEKVSATVTRLVGSDFFVMEHWRLTETLRLATDPKTLELYTVLSGNLTLTAGPHQLELRAADAVVLPAALGAYQLAGSGELIRCYLP